MVMNLRDNMWLYGINSEAGLARQRASVEEHSHWCGTSRPAMRSPSSR